MTNELFVSIAKIKIRWVSDCKSEIEMLDKLFRYHKCDAPYSGEPYHTVEFVPVWEPLTMPDDAVHQWMGRNVAGFKQQSVVNWYHSKATRLDYLIITDEVWIIHDRDNLKTHCCMRCRKTIFTGVKRPDISEAIIILLHTVMSMHNRYTIHASAIEMDGAAHVFVGESGHGKSTLCTDLVKQGVNYMGDDLVYLFMEGERVMVSSLLFEAKLFPAKTKKYKDQVDIIRDYGCETVQTSPVKAIYFIHRTNTAESTLELREPYEAMVRLIKSSNNARMQYNPEEWQRVCQSAAEQLPYYILHYGKRELMTKELLKNV